MFVQPTTALRACELTVRQDSTHPAALFCFDPIRVHACIPLDGNLYIHNSSKLKDRRCEDSGLMGVTSEGQIRTKIPSFTSR